MVRGNDTELIMDVEDINGLKVTLQTEIDGIQGLIAVANNMRLGENEKPGKSKFCL